MMTLTRRGALLGLTAAFTAGRASLALAAAPTENRLVVVLLRGALDGLAALAPYGDPAFAAWRGTLAPAPPGQEAGLLDLGGMFGLHPALAGLHAMYAVNELLPLHAVAGPTRSRSHFEAQDCLESGTDHRLDSGWLNRAVAAMPGNAPGLALSVGVAQPLLLRGGAPSGAWFPTGAQPAAADLYSRLAVISASDSVLGPAIRSGLRERGFSTAQLSGMETPKERYAFPGLAAAAARLLSAADGPRVAAMELGGWDTHAGQAARLGPPLRQLDAGLVALKDGLGDHWRRTVVLVVTEFGRTVRVNGTGGTDHGTGSAAFVVGGAVAGGRVLADWPGLADGMLLENRDLQPTVDLRALLKTVLAAQLGLQGPALAGVLPGSAGIQPMRGVLRTA